MSDRLNASQEPIESTWASLGVYFGAPPGRPSPDLERLLLDTARRCAAHPRLHVIAVSWLAVYADFVARSRLKRLVVDELEAEWRPALGLIVEEAIGLGAPSELLAAIERCTPAAPPGPLSTEFRASAALRAIAEAGASETSRRWGLWAPPVRVKGEALRPSSWILRHNPGYRDRLLRKGDLRCSIVEALRLDTPHAEAPSELALARLCGATRAAVRKSLRSLELENDAVMAPRREDRVRRPIRLVQAG